MYGPNVSLLVSMLVSMLVSLLVSKSTNNSGMITNLNTTHFQNETKHKPRVTLSPPFSAPKETYRHEASLDRTEVRSVKYREIAIIHQEMKVRVR